MSNRRNRDLRSDFPTVDETTEPTVTEGSDLEPAVIKNEEIVEETVTSPTNTIRGVVNKCVRLNVRKEPFDENSDNIIDTIKNGDKVTIDTNESTEQWCKIHTDSGLCGYCLRTFIKFEQ